MTSKERSHRCGEPTGEVKSKSNTSEAQRARLLAWLMFAPLTTLEARNILDVMSPAARIKELRQQGYPIIIHWTVVPTAAGEPRRIAKYVLVRGGKCNAKN